MRRLERFCSRKPTRFAFVVAIVEALGGASVRERKVRKLVPYAVGGFLSASFICTPDAAMSFSTSSVTGERNSDGAFLCPEAACSAPITWHVSAASQLAARQRVAWWLSNPSWEPSRKIFSGKNRSQRFWGIAYRYSRERFIGPLPLFDGALKQPPKATFCLSPNAILNNIHCEIWFKTPRGRALYRGVPSATS